MSVKRVDIGSSKKRQESSSTLLCLGLITEENILLRLSEHDRERYIVMKNSLAVKYDGVNPEHEEALAMLWKLAFPSDAQPLCVSSQWKLLGFQNSDPRTDFRGGGVSSLNNLIYFGNTYTVEFSDMVMAGRDYGLAAASINVTYILKSYLKLVDDTSFVHVQHGHRFAPTKRSLKTWVALFPHHPKPFEQICALSFLLLDRCWSEIQRKKPSITLMDFGQALVSMHQRVECVLSSRRPSVVSWRQLQEVLLPELRSQR